MYSYLTYLHLFIRDYYYAMFADGGFLTLHSYKVCMKGLMEKITKLPLDWELWRTVQVIRKSILICSASLLCIFVLYMYRCQRIITVTKDERNSRFSTVKSIKHVSSFRFLLTTLFTLCGISSVLVTLWTNMFYLNTTMNTDIPQSTIGHLLYSGT
jgi:Na+/melibiose symporter-like transporter